jgi:uncharacterized protein YndB with AHSA1/START domain
MEKFVVKKEIKIKATPPAVWRALTSPERTKKYFFNCEVFSDWKLGSSITFKGKFLLLKNIEMNGEIMEIQPDHILKYTLKNHGDSSSHSTVTDILSFKNGVTTLLITDDVGQGEGAEKRFKKSEKAWGKVLKGLKKVVEQEKKRRA